MQKRFLLLMLIACLVLPLAGGAANVRASGGAQADRLDGLIEEYRQKIPLIMKENNIPGLAIALVNSREVLWAEGYGCTDWDCKVAVTTATPFSIQSMTKSFTAAAVLAAVEEGLVQLDEPVSTYLPDFTVNSIFEDHPEDKITLRRLLSHTAGFTHEAPIGSNYDPPDDDHTFEMHIASISETWLKSPVGTRYSYSNLGIDLAGYILQVRSGMPFHAYVYKKLLEPLGMTNSTLDFAVTRANPLRARGHNGSIVNPPTTFLLIPAGGMYSSIDDMARYVRFYLNYGELDGKRVLSREHIELMYHPPFPPNVTARYGLGLTFLPGEPRMVEHGGGGFGFLSQMAWYPDLDLGVILLTNSANHEQQRELPLGLLRRAVMADPDRYDAQAAAARAPVPAPVDESIAALTTVEVSRLIEARSLPDDGAASQRRKAYLGRYLGLSQGLPMKEVELVERSGKLYFDHTLVSEVQPGLFFDTDGEALDLRGPRLSYRNIPMVKVNRGLRPVMQVLYGAGGVLALASLLVWPVRAVAARRRKEKIPGLLGLAGALVALGGLAVILSLGVLMVMPQLIDMPWPVAFADMGTLSIVLLNLPYAALALLAAGMSALALAWTRRAGPGWLRWFLAAAGVGLLACCLVLVL